MNLMRKACFKYGVSRVASLLEKQPKTIYNYLEGYSQLKISDLRELFRKTKDTELINDFLSGTGHVAVKIPISLNGKWEDEFKRAVVLMGEIIDWLERGMLEKAESSLGEMLNVIYQWKSEIEMSNKMQNFKK